MEVEVNLYARFSPRPDENESDSIDRQFRSLEQYCRAKELEVVGRFSDRAVSGADRNRVGMWDAVEATRRGMTLMVRDWSRLGRDTFLTLMVDEELRRKGGVLRSMTEGSLDSDDPTSRLIGQVMMAVYEFQRHVTRQRTRAAMRRMQREGIRMSDRLPYGYTIDEESPPNKHGNPSRMEVCLSEKAAVELIQGLHLNGRSLGEIAEILTERGYEPRGKRWYRKTISRIINRLGVVEE